jgi:hypothetical protein
MSKIKLAAVTLATVAGLVAVPGAAGAASASPASAEVYTTSSMIREMDNTIINAQGVSTTYASTVYFQVYSTYSSSQIWINGHVTCDGGGDAPVNITWCGVGGGNGTAVLNVGVNWDVPDWDAYGLYERMDLLANHGGCTTWGSNSAVGEIDRWANDSLVCEAGA